MGVTLVHGKAGCVREFLGQLRSFFDSLKSYAEQLTVEQRWCRILSKALEKYLKGMILAPPLGLPDTG